MIANPIRRLELAPPAILRNVLGGILWEGTPESNRVALTFDDGPDDEVTPLVLDTLDSVGAKATFFLIGEKVKAHPAIAREIVDRGHLVGNHTMTHQYLFLAGKKRVREEVSAATKTIEDATGMVPRWMRPPHGIVDFTAVKEIRRQRQNIVLWTMLSGDYRTDDVSTVIDRTAPFIRPGAIIVYHDTASGGGSDLPHMIEDAARRAKHVGCQLGRIDELSFKRGMECP